MITRRFTATTIRLVLILATASLLLLGACSGTDDTSDTTTTTVPPVSDEGGTTAATAPSTTTTTTVPPTTASTGDVAQDWLDSMAAREYNRAAQLATSSAGRFTHFAVISNQLDTYLAHEGLDDTSVSEGQLEWTYADGHSTMVDNLVVVDGLVADFDRNGEPISTMVPDEDGGPVEAEGITATITVVYHREDPSFGTITQLVVEIDNQTNEEIYGWNSQLVGSNRRSVEAELTLNGSYPADAISDDVIAFVGVDLTEGGELRIQTDFETWLKVPVPAVPGSGAAT
jgi:hypothetical protein